MDMTREELDTVVLALSKREDIPDFDPGSLAKYILEEIEATPGLCKEGEGLLMGVAAMLMRHDCELKAIAQTADVLARMKRSGSQGPPAGGDAVPDRSRRRAQ